MHTVEILQDFGVSSWAKQIPDPNDKIVRIGEDIHSKGYVIDGLENKLRCLFWPFGWQKKGQSICQALNSTRKCSQQVAEPQKI